VKITYEGKEVQKGDEKGQTPDKRQAPQPPQK
jgi:hypothetical protein